MLMVSCLQEGGLGNALCDCPSQDDDDLLLPQTVHTPTHLVCQDLLAAWSCRDGIVS